MKMRSHALLLTAFLAAGSLCWARVTGPVPSYRIEVRIEPATRSIDCKVEISHPGDSCFILNTDMVIHRVLADGKSVQLHQSSSASVPNSSEFNIGSIPQRTLQLEYSGKIKSESYAPIINSVNMVSPRLVELAMYVSWYPHLKNGARFYFQLQVDVPQGFVTVANGRLLKEYSAEHRTLTSWHSYEPVFDVAVLSAPALQKATMNSHGMTVEIYFDKVPASYVDSMKSKLIVAMDRLTSLLGSPQCEKSIRVAYSPRSTWGYVRKPLIIVSEENALTWRAQKFGPARDFRYLAHEMSHYWWGFADINTPEDWINEGLAEYSALLLSEDLAGKEFSDQLLSEYAQRAASSKTETAIAETGNNSPDREVNRYAKPTLLLNEARDKFGDDKMKEFLKALYLQFANLNNATTQIFLSVAEKSFGSEGKEFFERALYRKKWGGVGAK